MLQDSYMGGLCALMNLHWSREASETCYNQMALCLDKTCHAMAQTATFKHNKHHSKCLLQMGNVMSHDIANHMPEHTFNPQISPTRPAPKSCDNLAFKHVAYACLISLCYNVSSLCDALSVLTHVTCLICVLEYLLDHL